MRKKQPPTYEELKAQKRDLQRQLKSAHVARIAAEERAYAAEHRPHGEVISRAADLRDAWVGVNVNGKGKHGHPWSHEDVYNAGRALIKAAQQLPESGHES